MTDPWQRTRPVAHSVGLAVRGERVQVLARREMVPVVVMVAVAITLVVTVAVVRMFSLPILFFGWYVGWLVCQRLFVAGCFSPSLVSRTRVCRLCSPCLLQRLRVAPPCSALN